MSSSSPQAHALRVLGSRLAAADGFAGVAAITLAEAIAWFGASGAAMEALGLDGRPALWVGSAWLDVPAVQRYLRAGHRDDLTLAMLRRSHFPLGTASLHEARRHAERHGAAARPCSQVLTGALVGEGDLRGTLRIFLTAAPPVDRLAELAAMCAHVSVRLARVPRSPGPAVPIALTARQLQIARLVMGGFTNLEIGRSLGITVHGVKKHLAQIYERCDVTNRTELAALVGTWPPRHDASGEVTHGDASAFRIVHA